MINSRVLIVAGSDSGGGAGIQADIKAVTMMGSFAMTAITAITVQNTLGVFDVHPIPIKTIKDQITCTLDDIGADCIKTGMLGSVEIVEAVSDTLSKYKPIPRIIDPVMIAKGGHALLEAKAIDAVKACLIPDAYLLTPNAPEAEKLAGIAVENIDGQRRAAEKLLRLGAQAVLIKGGHIDGDNFIDLFATPNGETFFEAKRINTKNTHGTGCTLASAIAGLVAKGIELEAAIAQAREYVFMAIETAKGYGKCHGPLNHSWPIENRF